MSHQTFDFLFLVTFQSSSVCFLGWILQPSNFKKTCDFAVIKLFPVTLQSSVSKLPVNKNAFFLPFMPKLRGLPKAHSNQKVPKLYSFLFGRWHFLEDLFDNFVMLRTLALTASYPQRPLLLPQFLALDVALL